MIARIRTRDFMTHKHKKLLKYAQMQTLKKIYFEELNI